MLGDNADKIIKTVSNDSNGFVNTYYHSEEDFGYTDSLKNRIYLVFDKNRIKQEIVDLLASCKNYLRAEFKQEFIVFCFKIPDIYYNDFLLFKVGYYSKFSKEYKDLLIKSWPYKPDLKDILNPKESNLNQIQLILNTTERITEIQGRPDSIKETFKISNYFRLD